MVPATPDLDLSPLSHPSQSQSRACTPFTSSWGSSSSSLSPIPSIASTFKTSSSFSPPGRRARCQAVRNKAHTLLNLGLTSLSYTEGLFTLISLVLVAAGLLFKFFILLAGAVDGAPVNRWYLLEADTSGIPGAPPVSRWSYWNVCGVEGSTTVCGDESYSDVHPAFPLDPSSHRNFDTDVGVPQDFIDHHGFYFLMTRFMFAFTLIALFFGVITLLSSILAFCARIASYFSGLLAFTAAFFQAITAALMT